MKKIFLDNSGNVAFHRTEEGYLRGVARVVKAGVFPYKLDGKDIQVLRQPKDLFKKEAIDTLKMIPLTFRHPYKSDPKVVLLDAETTKKYTVGFSGEEIEVDGEYITAPLCVFDADSIGYVDNGINQLSAGYQAVLNMVPGVYEGKPYDAFQSDFKYNHIAIEESGRSGAEVSIVVMDAEDGDTTNKTKKEPGSMKKILLNGVEMEVADEIAVGVEKERTETSAKISQLQAVCDSANAELANLKKIDVEAVAEEKAKKRLETMEKVKICLDGDSIDLISLSPIDQKKKAIAKQFPTIALDSVTDEVYINGLFTAAVTKAEAEKQNKELNRQQFNDAAGSGVSSGTVGGSKEARQKYIDRLEGRAAK